MRRTALLFDLDGTLLDTLEDLYISVNEAFSQNGFPHRSREEVRLATGHGAAYLLRTLLPEDAGDREAAELLEKYKPILKKNQTKNTLPYKGVPEMLKKCRDLGYAAGIISNKPDEVTRGLKEIYFKEDIDACQGDAPDVGRKPDPDGALKVLAAMGKKPGDAVYIGDSETDVQSAKNLGVPSVGVTWGFRDRETLEKAGADYIIDKPEEIFDVLKRINETSV